MDFIEVIHKRYLELAYLLASSDGDLDKQEEEEAKVYKPKEISTTKNNELIKQTKEELSRNELSYTNSIRGA